MSGVHNKSAYTVQDPRSTVQYSFLKYNDKCFTPFTPPPQTAYILIPKTLSKFSKLNNKNNNKIHSKIPKIQKQLQEVKKTFRKQTLPKVDVLIPKHY